MKSYSAGSSRLGRCSSSRMSSLSLSGVLTGRTVAECRRDCQAEKENPPFGGFALLGLRSLRLDPAADENECSQEEQAENGHAFRLLAPSSFVRASARRLS